MLLSWCHMAGQDKGLQSLVSDEWTGGQRMIERMLMMSLNFLHLDLGSRPSVLSNENTILPDLCHKHVTQQPLYEQRALESSGAPP